MKRGILTIAAIIILMCASSCSRCNRTGQMIQWRDRGAVQAAQSLDSTILTSSEASLTLIE